MPFTSGRLRYGGGWIPSIDTDDLIRVDADTYDAPADPLPATGDGREAQCPGCRYLFAEAIARDRPTRRLLFSCPNCWRRFYVTSEAPGRPSAYGAR